MRRGRRLPEGWFSLPSLTTKPTAMFWTSMSTAFPVSVVLMELALHLQRIRLDLDLQLIPRDQNTEADALTIGSSGLSTKPGVSP